MLTHRPIHMSLQKKKHNFYTFESKFETFAGKMLSKELVLTIYLCMLEVVGSKLLYSDMYSCERFPQLKLLQTAE